EVLLSHSTCIFLSFTLIIPNFPIFLSFTLPPDKVSGSSPSICVVCVTLLYCCLSILAHRSLPPLHNNNRHSIF
ncbi:unnamed protein product, partial [Prunus brigantina]